MKSYDRQEGESSKAYAAFCVYRDMGVKRSLDRASAEIYSPDGAQKKPRNMSQLDAWAKKWRWTDRIRDFDLDQEKELRQAQRQRDMDEHNRKLENFRLQNEAVGTGLLTLSAQLLTTVAQMTAPLRAKVERGQPATREDWDVILSLPAAVKSIAGFAHLGSQLAADGLLVRQLIEQIKEEK